MIIKTILNVELSAKKMPAGNIGFAKVGQL